MKASELIKRLQELIEEYGDLELFESFSGDGMEVKKVYFEVDESFIDLPACFIIT